MARLHTGCQAPFGVEPPGTAIVRKRDLTPISLEKLQDAQYRDFLEILDDRQGGGATLMTSQFPMELWHDTVGNPTVADAILDRPLHNAHRIELKGESMRTRQSQAE